jgi:hypothetical protein
MVVFFPRDDLRRPSLLRGDLVSQHWLADQVADRSDIAGECCTAIVYLDEAAVHRDRVLAATARERLSTYRNQDFSGVLF